MGYRKIKNAIAAIIVGIIFLNLSCCNLQSKEKPLKDINTVQYTRERNKKPRTTEEMNEFLKNNSDKKAVITQTSTKQYVEDLSILMLDFTKKRYDIETLINNIEKLDLDYCYQTDEDNSGKSEGYSAISKENDTIIITKDYTKNFDLDMLCIIKIKNAENMEEYFEIFNKNFKDNGYIIDKTNADKGLYIYVPKKDSKNSEIKLYYLKEQNRFHIHVQANVT